MSNGNTACWQEIESLLLEREDPEQAFHLMRFFKTGKGEYGEGDAFLGVKVPVTREIVGRFRRTATLEDVGRLTRSPWHEVRLAGFLLAIEVYKRAKKSEEERRHIVDYYLSILERGNNWDLVDLVAPKILGDWLLSHPEERGILDELAAREDSLWHQRVSIVSCWTLIRDGEFEEALRISEKFLSHKHDLIHKATGWMLREIGKRDGLPDLLAFLDIHATRMPRTMLRYAIEKLPEPTRQHYLHLK